MIKDFEKVCSCYNEGVYCMSEAEKILNILSSGELMRAKDIAEKSGFYTYQHASKILSMLIDLDLVVREKIKSETPVKIKKEKYIPYKAEDTVIINGVVYVKQNAQHQYGCHGHWEEVEEEVYPVTTFFRLA